MIGDSYMAAISIQRALFLTFQGRRFSSVFVLANVKQGVPQFRPLSWRKLGNA
jgi:hypothetical protein